MVFVRSFGGADGADGAAATIGDASCMHWILTPIFVFNNVKSKSQRPLNIESYTYMRAATA